MELRTLTLPETCRFLGTGQWQ